MFGAIMEKLLTLTPSIILREHSDDNDIHSRVERQQVLVSGLKEHEALFNHVFVLGKSHTQSHISLYKGMRPLH